MKVDVRQLVIQSLLSPLRSALYFSSSPFPSAIYPLRAGFPYHDLAPRTASVFIASRLAE